MTLENNLKTLKSILVDRGWYEVMNEDLLFCIYSNDFVLKDKVLLYFPLDSSSRYFPRYLISSLENLIKIDPDLKKYSLVADLFSQAKNIKQKYSKNKKEWILSEPDSKYTINEIPDIYVPKL